MKKSQILLIIFLFILSLPILVLANEISGEDISISKNPDRGFYRLVQVELQDGDENFNDFENSIKSTEKNYPEISLISFQLNLINYVPNDNNTLTSKIKDINKYFSIMREHGYKVIFRVVYDSQGKTNPEPEFNIILKQIEELKSIYTTNEDIIFVVEAGYLGAYGEWHDGKYDKDLEKKNQIIQKLLEVIPEEIQINLRKPMFITDYIGNKSTISETNAFSNEAIARLGLHNDGYLASETDLGTYEKNARNESLKWQNIQTKYTAFGGEAQNKDSAYNNLNNAIEDMFNRHCNYLNRTYDREVKEKWENTKYTGNDTNYIGQNGMTYIKNHLGYRLLLKEVSLQENNKVNELTNINVKIANIGFGNIIRRKEVSIIYKNDKNIYEVKTNIDIRKKLKDGNYEISINEKLPGDIEAGEYDVYLCISEPYETLKNNSNYYIKLVNMDIWNEETKGNYLGNIKIEANDDNITDNNENKNTTNDEDDKNSISKEDTISQEKLPAAGIKNICFGIIMIFVVVISTFKLKNSKRKDI